ncbi:MAG: methylglyoxal synthase [Xenococcaceae cyanobacterium MO_188.B32]|nr:methylglyoxal synthase [Xenococcaceae cyanobacterium MO_188.B32]
MSATIAVINRQNQLENTVNFLRKHQAVLSRYRLVTPEEIGTKIQAETDLSVDCLLPSYQGGDSQLTSLVAKGEITAVICLLDTDYTQFQEPNIQVLQRICVVKNVPIAINLATAEIIIDRLRRNRIAHLIFNPVSGQGNADEDLAIIKKLLQPAMELIVHPTTTEISPEKLAKDAIESQADLIIASGGDGTVSTVSGALIGTDIPLGIIPRGTANAFSKALGIPFGFNPIQSACEVIIEGHTHTVDVSCCNGLPMILLAGLGLEAETIERADREAKDRWGVFAYIMAGIQQLKEQELFTTEIEVEGVVKKFHAGAVTIANAAPPTSVMAQGFGSVNLKDGLLDVTIAAPTTDLETVTAMASLLGAALFKTPTNRDDIINLKTKKIKVTTDPPQKVVLDGEMIGTTPIEVECIPSGLTVLAPPPKN